MTESVESYQSLKRILHAMGWTAESMATPSEWPRGTSPDGYSSLIDNASPLYLMDNGVRELIVLVADGDVLPTLHDTIGVFRDFSHDLAAMLDMAAAFAAPGEHVLMADSSRFYLYDIDSHEPILAGETRSDREDHLYPLLSHRHGLRAALERLPRRGPEQLGYQFQHFLDTVRHEIGAVAEASREEVERFVLRLLVSIFHSQREPRDVATRPIRLFWERLTLRDDRFIGEELLRSVGESFELLYRRFSLNLFREKDGASGFFERWSCLAEPEEGRWIARLLEGFLLQMPAKYRSDVLEHVLLGDEDIRKTWQRSIREPLDLDKFLHHEGAVVYQPVEVDVGRNGIGWGLKTLRACLDLIETERLEQLEHVKKYRRANQTPDLFQAASPGANSLGIVEDPVMMAINDAVRWTGLDRDNATPSFLLAAEVLVAVTVWEWLWDAEHPERRRLHTSFAAAPRMIGCPDVSGKAT